MIGASSSLKLTNSAAIRPSISGVSTYGTTLGTYPSIAPKNNLRVFGSDVVTPKKSDLKPQVVASSMVKLGGSRVTRNTSVATPILT